MSLLKPASAQNPPMTSHRVSEDLTFCHLLRSPCTSPALIILSIGVLQESATRENMQRNQKEEMKRCLLSLSPKWVGPQDGQGGVTVRTLGCGRSGTRWPGMVPEVTESKTLTPVKGAFVYNTNLDTSQPGPWGIYPKFFYPRGYCQSLQPTKLAPPCL